MKRLSILLSIFLIIVISGCIDDNGTVTVSTKDGVAITDLSFDHSPVYGKDNVVLRLEVQNVGGSRAELKKIQVYGVDFGSSGGDWIIRGNGLRELDKSFIQANLPSGGDLYQPDPVIEIEGATDYYEWKLRAPSGVTSETDYDFRVRVEYNYNTTYSGIIRVIDDNYLQSLNEEERQKLYSSGGIVSSELTNGPISVIPFSGRHFIIDPTDLGDRIMKFKIENVGKGYPYICDVGLGCEQDDTNAKKYYLRTSIVGDIISCNEQEMKLSSGESHILYCTFMPSKVGSFTNKVDKQFQIIFEYSYYIDGSSPVTVKPTY